MIRGEYTSRLVMVYIAVGSDVFIMRFSRVFKRTPMTVVGACTHVK